MLLPHALERPLSLPAWLLPFFGLVLLLGLGAFPIYIVDEARNAQAAWEMYREGSWIVPTFNGGVRTDKPPLHYYAMILAYQALGKTALAARLGSALCGFLTAFTLYYFTQKTYGKTSATLTVLVYLLGFYVPLQFHLATPDAYLAAFFTLGMLALHQGFQDRDRSYLYLGYVALGVATLTKGPVALVLAALGWGIYCLADWQHFLRNVLRLRPLEGLVIVSLVALPWFMAVHFATDGLFTEGFFLEHNLARFSHTKEGHGGSPLLIPAFVLLALLPFGFWLPRGLWALRERDKGLAWLAGATAIGVALFFAMSKTKLPSYPFPALGFAAIVIATWLRRFWQGRGARRSDHWAFALAVLVLASVPVAAYLGLRQDRVLRALTPLWWQFTLVLPFALYAIWQWSRRRFTRGLAGLALGFYALQIFLFASFLPRFNAFNQVAAATPLLASAPDFCAFGRFAPAYVFAFDGPIVRYEDAAELAEWLATAPDGALVLTAERYLPSLPSDLDLREVFRQKDLFEYPTTVIYRYYAHE